MTETPSRFPSLRWFSSLPRRGRRGPRLRWRPLTIWAGGAPLATAITAIAAYRLLGWLSVPPALASLPVLRETSGRPR